MNRELQEMELEMTANAGISNLHVQCPEQEPAFSVQKSSLQAHWEESSLHAQCPVFLHSGQTSLSMRL